MKSHSKEEEAHLEEETRKLREISFMKSQHGEQLALFEKQKGSQETKTAENKGKNTEDKT